MQKELEVHILCVQWLFSTGWNLWDDNLILKHISPVNTFDTEQENANSDLQSALITQNLTDGADGENTINLNIRSSTINIFISSH